VSDWTDEQLLQNIEQLWVNTARHQQHIRTLLEVVLRQAEEMVLETRELEQAPRRAEQPQQTLDRLLDVQQRLQDIATAEERVLEELDRLFP